MTADYGPNSVAVERLLDDLDHLPPGTVAVLAAEGGPQGAPGDDSRAFALTEVRARLRGLAVDGGRLDAIRAVGNRIEAWASSTKHWFPAGVAGAGASTAEIGPRMAAAPVILDAAYAVVLEDLLDDDDLDLLLAPWEGVVGSPFGDRPDGWDRDGGGGVDAAEAEADNPG